MTARTATVAFYAGLLGVILGAATLSGSALSAVIAVVAISIAALTFLGIAKSADS